MFKRIGHFWFSEIRKDAFRLLAGNVMVQVIAFISYPVLSRLYSPNEMGVFYLFNSIIILFVAAIPGRYDFAAAIAPNSRITNILLRLSLGILLAYCAFLAIVILPVKSFFPNLFDLEIAGTYLLLIPLFVFTTGVLDIVLNSFYREKAYSKIAVFSIINRLCISLGAICLGLWFDFDNGLIWGALIGGALTLAFLSPRLHMLLNFKVRARHFLKIGKDYKDFLLYVSPMTFLAVVSRQITFYLIALWFGSSILGHFSLAFATIAAPLHLIGSSFGPVLLRHISAYIEDRDYIVKFIQKVWLTLLLLGITPTIIMFLYGTEIFVFIFGESWLHSGKIASVLFPMTIFLTINSLVVRTVGTYRKRKMSFVFLNLMILSRFLSLYVGFIYSDFYLAIYLYAIVNILLVVLNSSLFVYQIKNRLSL